MFHVMTADMLRGMLATGLVCALLVAADSSASADGPTVGAEAAAGTIRGTVTDRDSGEGVPGAAVQLSGTDHAAITEADGSYVLSGVAAGGHTLEVHATGYAVASRAINLGGEAEQRVDVAVDYLNVTGEEIVITGSRTPEKRLDAPVTIEVVSERDLRASAGATYLSALSDVKGIDFADNGLGDQRISARGFATQFNTRMLSMVDGRLAQLPGSGLPQQNLLPNSSLDMKAVEVVVGPASALYGPNAHSGVVNVLTKTPWDESGASVALRGGTRKLVDGSVRVAGTIADDFGYKFNGQYMRAQDFSPERDSPTHFYGTSIFEGDLVDRYQLASIKADGQLYYRFIDGWVAQVGAGFSESDGFSLTNAGRNHLRDWQVQYQSVQFSGPNWHGQFTRTASDAGRSYQLDRLARTVETMGGVDAVDVDALRDEMAFVDESSMMDAELQYRNRFFGIDTTAGTQLRRYTPHSAGTYLDDADEGIDIYEIGAYLQLDTRLFNDRLRLAAAGRVDSHSQYRTQISPKASVQYTVAPLHNVRVSYNRAFKSPTILENYLLINDILVGNRSGFTIRDASGAALGEIDPLVPEQVDAVEVGYKGVIANQLFIDVTAYNSWYRDFISPLTQVANPAGAEPTFASTPDGMPVAAGTPLEGTLFTYVNFGRAVVRGVDAGLTYEPLEGVTMAGSVSAIDIASFDNTNPLVRDLELNAPRVKLKGSLTLRDLGISGYFVKLSTRYNAAYRFDSGYWQSSTFYPNGEVPDRVVLDASLGATLPGGISLSFAVQNLLDNNTPDVLGAPTPRRFGYLQLTYHLPGLNL